MAEAPSRRGGEDEEAPHDATTNNEANDNEADPVTEALEILSQTDPEEVEIMSQVDHNDVADMIDNDEDSLPDAEIAQALEDSFRRRRGSSPTDNGPFIPFLKQLNDMAERKREVFFALYFDLKAPKNPETTNEVTFGEIWDAAGVVAYNLRHNWKIDKGQRVILCYNYGSSGLAALLGCWRAGVVALVCEVPTARPYYNLLEQLNQRAKECQPIAMVLTDKKTFRRRNADLSNIISSSRKLWLPSAKWRETESLPYNPALRFFKKSGEQSSQRPEYTFDEPTVSFQDLALIQYTSGSTGPPRPVMINFSAIQACLDMTQRFFDVTFSTEQGSQMAEITGMSHFSHLPTEGTLWGLVHATLIPMMNGWRMYYMSPQEFGTDPLLWLHRMSQHKITWALALDPDYPRILDSFLQAKEKAKGLCPIPHLDLSCIHHWHVLGQPLRAETRDLVNQVLQEYGLRDSWYTASYGLTEHVAGALFLAQNFVTAQQPDDWASPPTRRVAVASRESLDADIVVKIVDPKTHMEVQDGQVGELWLSSSAIASGYCKNAELTRERFGVPLQPPKGASQAGSLGRFLRTGDAAYFLDDNLFLCGPLADSIVIGDKTVYYPQDVEWIVEQATVDVIPGCVAAIVSEDNRNLEIVFEVASNHHHDPHYDCKLVAQAVERRFGITPKHVVAIREDDISRTCSGKIQRHETKRRLKDDKLDILVDFFDLLDGKPVQIDSVEYLQRAQDLDKVIFRYFGADFDVKQPWEELGLTSLTSIDLRYDIAHHCSVYISASCFEENKTPASLKEFILQSRGMALPTKMPYEPLVKCRKMSWLFMGVVQAFLSVVILVLFSAPIIPIWYIFKVLWKVNLLLAIVPIYMTSFSLIVLLAKWIVIGRYLPCRFAVPSSKYLAWWFVDRLADMWEFWVGRFIVNTPLLNLFYICLGAKISMSAKLEGFVREYDLITVGPNASLQHRSLRGRKFSSWNRSEAGPKMTLQPIVIGSRSHIRGLLSPGVTIGESAFVEKLAVVPEGARVEDRAYVAGNPAVVTGRAPYLKCNPWWVVGLCKIKWLVIEFYIFLVLVLSVQWSIEIILPWTYYRMWIVWWALFIPIFSIISLTSSIAVKWIFLGRRSIGKYTTSATTEFLEWAADYHFFMATLIFQTFLLNSRFCNVILMLHGMDIDLASKVYLDSFPPSKIDFLHIRQSYVAGATFDVNKYGAFYPTYVQESSVGEQAHVDAGLIIQKAVIPPVSIVSARTQLPKITKQGLSPPVFSICKELLVIVVYMLVIVCVTASIYAGYLYWGYMRSFGLPGWSVIFVWTGCIGIQSTLWMVLILVLQLITYIGVSENQPTPWSSGLYAVFLSSSESFQTWSIVSILWGTQMFNDIARVFGSSIEGRTLFFGNRMYDGPFLTVSNRTVSDGSKICGHSIVYEEVTLGPTRVAGLIHEGTLVIANANICTKDSGPLRPVVARSTTKPHYLSFSQDLEAPETKMV